MEKLYENTPEAEPQQKKRKKRKSKKKTSRKVNKWKLKKKPPRNVITENIFELQMKIFQRLEVIWIRLKVR